MGIREEMLRIINGQMAWAWRQGQGFDPDNHEPDHEAKVIAEHTEDVVTELLSLHPANVEVEKVLYRFADEIHLMLSEFPILNRFKLAEVVKETAKSLTWLDEEAIIEILCNMCIRMNGTAACRDNERPICEPCKIAAHAILNPEREE